MTNIRLIRAGIIAIALAALAYGMTGERDHEGGRGSTMGVETGGSGPCVAEPMGSAGAAMARNRTLVPKAVRLIIGFRQVVTA